MRLPSKAADMREWRDFKRMLTLTINNDPAGYLRKGAATPEEYLRGHGNPHCHTLTAIHADSGPKLDGRVALILTFPDSHPFKVVHSIVLSPDCKRIVADTYNGHLEGGNYVYGQWSLEIAAAWRLGELKRAANNRTDLDKLITAKAALNATARK